MSKNRIFSGVQPTGSLHLGNYLGAIRNWARLQDEFEAIYCVVDLHAVTAPHDPKELSRATREVTAGLIASGIDPARSIIFNQSMVPEHAELSWLFSCVARLGWLNRMTQFKEKAGKNREQASVGLYAYPVLMAADILAYKATHVPVGEDQKQHLELTRDIAQSFNSTYRVDYFPLPEPQIFGSATRVMSLRDGTKKMSKSDESDYSRINMTDGADEIEQKIRKEQFDLQDFLDQLNTVRRMGPLSQVMEMIPGFAGLKNRVDSSDSGDALMNKMEAIIQSMTLKERTSPGILNGSRRKRIAFGSGTTVQEVNQLLGRFNQMEKMIRQINTRKGSGLDIGRLLKG